MIGQHIGKYVIKKQLGRGAMGVVYEAVHEDIGHRAAVKCLSAELRRDPQHEDYVKRFFVEACAVNVVNHPGLVRIFDFGEMADGTVYFMMDLLEGESLFERMCRLSQSPAGKLPLAEAVRIARQVAATMAHVHAKDIVHRDIKPGNILLCPDPEVPRGERAKVLDFGISKFLDSPERLTTVGAIMGTVVYMAPEQCRASEHIDEKADVYALGAMLFEMLAGRPPFQGALGTVISMHLSAQPQPLRDLVPGLPRGLGELVHEMLRKKPERRPPMSQVTARLKALEPATPPGAETLPTPLLGASGPHGPRSAYSVHNIWPLLAAALTGALITLVLVGVLWVVAR